MNAPTPDVTPRPSIEYLPILELKPSPTNPRKRFDAAQLEDLGASIAKQGILQPLLVRPLDARHFEIVCGERRYRAAKAVGLPDVPCLVRSLTDVEVLEVQVVENLQRSDLHPLEEAEGYEALMKKHSYTVEDIAAKVGKSVAYVYARLKLTALCPEARKWYDAGKLNASTALLIARIPVPSLQEKAAREIGDPKYRSEPLSFREASEHLQRNFMLQLERAPFPTDDATLTPGAGACGPCKRRTGNQADLFPDVKSGDICTDPGCFQAKRIAFGERRIAEAKVAGITIVRGKQAKEIKPSEWGGLTKGYVGLDERDYAIDQEKTIRELLGKDAKPSVLIENPHEKGSIIEAITRDELKHALKANGLKAPREAGAPKVSPEQREKAKAEEAKLEREIEARRRVLAQIYAKHDGKLSQSAMAEIFVSDVFPNSNAEEIAALFGWPTAKGAKWVDEQAVAKWARTASEKDLGKAMTLCLLTSELHPHGAGTHLFATAKRLRIDVAKIRRELAAEEKVEAKPEAGAKSKTTKKAPAKKAAKGAKK